MALRKPDTEFLPHYTYDDYKEWEGKWELLYGMPYAMSPAPMVEHQSISGNIMWQLRELFANCQKCHPLLPVDWKISEDIVVQPDNLVVCDEDLSGAYITKTPKIIFEVISKSTARKDEGLKFSLYEAEGVEYYVLVYPKEKIAKVYKLRDGRYIKVGDFKNETLPMHLSECEGEADFDFSKIWTA